MVGKASYWDGSKTVDYEDRHRNSTTCGKATACPAAISSISDKAMSDMKMGFAVQVLYV
jgi:hypothetical protein